MRILIANHHHRKVGGVETYLNSIVPEFLAQGFEVGFLHEVEGEPDRDPIELPSTVTRWSVEQLGVERALAGVREWQPSLIFSHVLTSTELDAQLLELAPGVFFAHNYYGTCISGTKAFKLPTIQPCDRAFGWGCLAHYYPRRCGGLNPATMLREYRRNSDRLDLLRRYSALVTNSRHMRQEYINNGFDPKKVFYTVPVAERGRTWEGMPLDSLDGIHLVFSARMDLLKGGAILLEAAPKIASMLRRPVRVTFSGDGPERPKWEAQAKEIESKCQGLAIEFVGWLDEPVRDRLLSSADLLVVPSLWPEPFGLVGPEAGLRGLPAAAFAVGGITDWLEEGINGHLAPGSPGTAAGLAEAVVRCFATPEHYARLRTGAHELAQRYTLQNHLPALLEAFSVAAPGAAPLAVRSRV